VFFPTKKQEKFGIFFLEHSLLVSAPKEIKMEAFGNGASFNQLVHRLALGTIMQFRVFFTELFKVKTCCKI
jgi:hypothetical protein